MTAIGTIVSIAGQKYRWAVMEAIAGAVPPDQLYRLVKIGDVGHMLTAPGSDLTTLVAAPTYSEGDVVRTAFDNAGTVVSDDGDVVRVSVSREAKAGTIGRHSWTGEIQVNKAVLVALNT